MDELTFEYYTIRTGCAVIVLGIILMILVLLFLSDKLKTKRSINIVHGTVLMMLTAFIIFGAITMTGKLNKYETVTYDAVVSQINVEYHDVICRTENGREYNIHLEFTDAGIYHPNDKVQIKINTMQIFGLRIIEIPHIVDNKTPAA